MVIRLASKRSADPNHAANQIWPVTLGMNGIEATNHKRGFTGRRQCHPTVIVLSHLLNHTECFDLIRPPLPELQLMHFDVLDRGLAKVDERLDRIGLHMMARQIQPPDHMQTRPRTQLRMAFKILG